MRNGVQPTFNGGIDQELAARTDPLNLQAPKIPLREHLRNFGEEAFLTIRVKCVDSRFITKNVMVEDFSADRVQSMFSLRRW